MVETEYRHGVTATPERKILLFQGSFIDLPPDQFAAWVADGTHTVKDLSDVGNGLLGILEDPKPHHPEQIVELVQVAAERRVLILDEITKRLEEAKSALNERIANAQDEAQTLRDEHGID